jgi:hypothetical protein
MSGAAVDLLHQTLLAEFAEVRRPAFVLRRFSLITHGQDAPFQQASTF